MEELLARLRALLRRLSPHSSALWHCGPIGLDTRQASAWVHQVPIDLTSHEFKLLQLLMRRPGHVLTRTQLAEHIYPPGQRARLQHHRGVCGPPAQKAPPAASKPCAAWATAWWKWLITTPILYERPCPARPAAQAQPTYSCAAACCWAPWAGSCWRYQLRLGDCVIYFKAISRRNCKTNCSCNSTDLGGAVRSDAQGQLPRASPLATDPRWSARPVGPVLANRQPSPRPSAPAWPPPRCALTVDQVLPLPAQAEWGSHAPEGHSVWTLRQEGQRLLAVSRHIHLPEEGTPTLRITVAAE